MMRWSEREPLVTLSADSSPVQARALCNPALQRQHLCRICPHVPLHAHNSVVILLARADAWVLHVKDCCMASRSLSCSQGPERHCGVLLSGEVQGAYLQGWCKQCPGCRHWSNSASLCTSPAGERRGDWQSPQIAPLCVAATASGMSWISLRLPSMLNPRACAAWGPAGQIGSMRTCLPNGKYHHLMLLREFWACNSCCKGLSLGPRQASGTAVSLQEQCRRETR